MRRTGAGGALASASLLALLAASTATGQTITPPVVATTPPCQTNFFGQCASPPGSPTAADGGSTAGGGGASASGSYSTAYGAYSQSPADHGGAFGGQASATGPYGLAAGFAASAGGLDSVAIGSNASSGDVNNNFTTAVGQGATASSGATTALGHNAIASGSLGTAVGTGSQAVGVSSTAVGDVSVAGDYSTALGNFAGANVAFATAVGYQANATAVYSTAVGDLTNASNYFTTTVGQSSQASGAASTALGHAARAEGDNSLALGASASASGLQSVALGSGSSDQGADQVVSLGNVELTRRITNLAPGIDGTDGVNVNQLNTAIAESGGGGGSGPIVASGTGAQPTAAGGDALAAGLNTTAGGDASTAVGNGASATAANAVALGNRSVADQDDAVSVGAVGAERKIVNVAAGDVTASSTDAVNGSELYALAQQVSSSISNDPVTYDDATHAHVTLGSGTEGGSPLTTLGNVAAGQATTDAVNVGQLDAAIGSVAGGGAGIVAQNNSMGSAPANATGANSLAAGAGSQATGAGATALGLGALATGSGAVALGAGSVADQADTVSVGAVGAERRIVNVAAGAVNAGSTDAVTGGQLFVTNTAVGVAQTTANTALSLAGNSVQYDGASHAGVTLDPGGGAAGLHNVAAGALAAGSADAVNGSQLYAVSQTAGRAATEADNSVQYDSGARTSATLDPGAGPTVLHNLAAGTLASDAATVWQVQSAQQAAVTQSEAYTDRWQVKMKRELRSDTAAAMAFGGLLQATTPGKSLVTGGFGMFDGEGAVAFGASHRMDDGHWAIKAGAAVAFRGGTGATAAVGYEF